MTRIITVSLAVAMFMTLIPATNSQSLRLEASDSSGNFLDEDCVADVSCAQCGEGYSCARCRKMCCSTYQEVTEEKTCWKVTCEEVCVPAIRLPWEPGSSGLTIFNFLHKKRGKTHHRDCCDCTESIDRCPACGMGDPCGECTATRCGNVRCVHILGKEKYDVTKCQCKWEIRRLPNCCDDHECGATFDGEDHNFSFDEEIPPAPVSESAHLDAEIPRTAVPLMLAPRPSS